MTATPTSSGSAADVRIAASVTANAANVAPATVSGAWRRRATWLTAVALSTAATVTKACRENRGDVDRARWREGGRGGGDCTGQSERGRTPTGIGGPLVEDARPDHAERAQPRPRTQPGGLGADRDGVFADADHVDQAIRPDGIVDHRVDQRRFTAGNRLRRDWRRADVSTITQPQSRCVEHGQTDDGAGDREGQQEHRLATRPAGRDGGGVAAGDERCDDARSSFPVPSPR